MKSELPFRVGKGNILKSNNYSKAGHWTQSENMKFTMFVDFYKHVFTGNYNNRQVRMFVFMAEFMKTRNSVQCRTHFQKMMRQYKSVPNMIKQIRQITGQAVYQKLSSIYADEFQGLKPLIFDKISDKNLRSKEEQEQNHAIPINTKQDQKYQFLQTQVQNKLSQNQNLALRNSNFLKTLSNSGLENFKQVQQETMKNKDFLSTNDRLQQNQQAQEDQQFNLVFDHQNRKLQKFDPSIYNHSMTDIYRGVQQFYANLSFIQTNPNFYSISTLIQKQQNLPVSIQKEELIKEKNMVIQECQQHWEKWLISAIKLQELNKIIQSLELKINEYG